MQSQEVKLAVGRKMKTSQAKRPVFYKQAAAKIAGLLRGGSFDVRLRSNFEALIPRMHSQISLWGKRCCKIAMIECKCLVLPYLQIAVRGDFNPAYIDALVAAYFKLDLYEKASVLLCEAEKGFPESATVAAECWRCAHEAEPY